MRLYRRAACLIAVLLLPVACRAQEVIPKFSEETVSVLNDELKRLDDKSSVWKKSVTDVKMATPLPLDMQQREMKGVVIENRASDPASPAVGQIWYRSDL
jgi:hypothetical protein